MDIKNLRIDSGLGTNINDGSIKYAQSGKLSQTERKTYGSNLELQSLGKLDTQVSRPCAIIGPDRVLPPNPNDGYGKTGPEDLWPCSDNYRQLYEHPLKMTEYQPSRNISPRQTFQENMQRIMVPPTYSSIKNSDEPSLKNNKLNVPPDAKYCDVPFIVNTLNNEHKTIRNVDNINPAFARNVPGNGWPGVGVRPLRPYPAPEFYQYQEYSSLPGLRQMPMVRPQESTQVYSDRLYQDANLRFKPYPTIKERYPQTRYEYISNCVNPYPPSTYPPHKFDIPKSLQNHPYPMYHQAPLKYIDRRMTDPIMDGFQRPPNPHVNMTSFRNHIPPPYGPIPGNCYQNKSYPYSADNIKPGPLNKVSYDTNNRVYLDLDNSRHKMYENLYYNENSQLIRGDIVMPGHSINSMPHAMYRKDNTLLKSFDYPSHYKNIDQSVNSMSRIPIQFSPNAIAISPCDSNASNENSQTMGALQEDCGYVSQSSTTSLKSYDNGMTNDIYKRQDYQNMIPLQGRTHKSEINTKTNLPNKKGLNVRQFLQMWNEGDEDADNNKEVMTQGSTNHSTSNEEQLYVLGLVNVPNEELGKYDHLQKLSKLPENIKGYNYIELLNQYEKLVESPNFSNVHAKSSREYPIFSKNIITKTNKDTLPRPLSPLDVEAKISQSVIHKEVGCNFEIKPCSPKLLNVDVATPVHDIIRERIIEKVTNPVLMNVANLKDSMQNIVAIDSMQSSCNLSNKQYLDSIKSNNYNLQDLETNTSVCLASLPQLDNDIELNFPEVNQQFINATKTDTSAPASAELQRQQHVESKLEFLQNQDLSAQIPNKESTKLSKYRKVKKNEVPAKESELSLKDPEKADSPSTIQHRINSVIIKNPDNTKFQASGYTLSNKNKPIIIKDTGNEISESLKYCFSSSSSSIEEYAKTYNKNAAAAAIDFSINKNENNPSRSDINTNDTYIDCNADSYQNNQDTANVRSNSLFDNDIYNIVEECSVEMKEPKLYEKKNIQQSSMADIETLPKNLTTDKKENSILLEKKINICNLINDSLLKESNTTEDGLYNKVRDPQLFLTEGKNLQLPKDMATNEYINFKDNCTILHQREENISDLINNTMTNNKNVKEKLSNKIEDSICCDIKIQKHFNLSEDAGTPKNINKDEYIKVIDTVSSQNQETSPNLHCSDLLLIDSMNYSNEDNEGFTDQFNKPNVNSSRKLKEINLQQENSLSKSVAQEKVDLEENRKENHIVDNVFALTEAKTLLLNNAGKEKHTVENDNLSSYEKEYSGEENFNVEHRNVEEFKAEKVLQENENDKSHKEESKEDELSQENENDRVPKEESKNDELANRKEPGINKSPKKIENKNYEEAKDEDKSQKEEINDNNTSLKEMINGSEVEFLEKNTLIQEKNNVLRTDIQLENSVKQECDETSLLYQNDNNKVLVPECVTTIEESSDHLLLNMTKENTNTYSIQKHTSVTIDSQQFHFNQNDSHHIISDQKTILDLRSKDEDLKVCHVNKSTDKNESQQISNDENSASHCFQRENADLKVFTTEKGIHTMDKANYDLDTEKSKPTKICPSLQINDINSSCPKTENYINNNSKNKSKPKKIKKLKQSKELFSPRIQKLLLFAEGLCFPTINSDLLVQNRKSIPITAENHANVNIIDIKNNNINQNDKIYKHGQIESQNILSSNILNNQDKNSVTSDRSFQQIPIVLETKEDKIEHEMELNVDSIDNTANICYIPEVPKIIHGKLITNNSNDKTPLKHKGPLSSLEDSLITKRRTLKRSLSESAIEAYSENDDKDTLFSKRTKLLPADLCSIFQTNRRNSIAEIYNEDSVYILIDDNNYVITEENDTEKICYTEIVPIHSSIDANIEAIHMVHENDNCESCDSSSVLHNIEEKSLNETWVEDVACMETIFNDDIAEDIIISAPGSPNGSVNSACDTDDEQHMEKVKDIYGGNMCNIDAQLVETLYRTPQMNVNKTLVNIEFPSTEEVAYNDGCYNRKTFNDSDICNDLSINTKEIVGDSNISFKDSIDKTFIDKDNLEAETASELISKEKTHATIQLELVDYATNSEESTCDDMKLFKKNKHSPKYCISSSSEVTSTTSEERNSSLLLKTSNFNGSQTLPVNEDTTNKKLSYKLTENNHYKSFNTNYNSSGVLITKAAQKYIPPVKETMSNLNLKVKLALPQHSLNKLKQLKSSKVEPKMIKKLPSLSNLNSSDLKSRHDIVKKQKPKFEDVLMNIDKIQLKKCKDAKRVKGEIPKVVIKKNESGAHYASSSSVNKKDNYNPDLTGRKWQPWVFLEKNIFIDKMAIKNKDKAIFCHRKNSYVFAEKFRKYKSVYNAKFVISQPKPADVTKGNLKYTIRLKHLY